MHKKEVSGASQSSRLYARHVSGIASLSLLPTQVMLLHCDLLWFTNAECKPSALVAQYCPLLWENPKGQNLVNFGGFWSNGVVLGLWLKAPHPIVPGTYQLHHSPPPQKKGGPAPVRGDYPPKEGGADVICWLNDLGLLSPQCSIFYCSFVYGGR